MDILNLNVVENFRVQNSGSTFSKWQKYDYSFITSLYYALAVLGFFFFFENTLAVLVDYTYFVTFERRIVTYKLQFHSKKTYYDIQDRLGINKTNIQSCP